MADSCPSCGSTEVKWQRANRSVFGSIFGGIVGIAGVVLGAFAQSSGHGTADSSPPVLGTYKATRVELSSQRRLRLGLMNILNDLPNAWDATAAFIRPQPRACEIAEPTLEPNEVNDATALPNVRF